MIQVTNTKNKRHGDTVYTVTASDDENDAVFFSMYTTPESDLFTIGYSTYCSLLHTVRVVHHWTEYVLFTIGYITYCLPLDIVRIVHYWIQYVVFIITYSTYLSPLDIVRIVHHWIKYVLFTTG